MNEQPQSTLDWLKTTLAAHKIRRVGLLAELDPATMPPLMVAGVPLNEREIGGLLGALKMGDGTTMAKIAAVLHEYGDPDELFAFATRLFTAWQTLPLYKRDPDQQWRSPKLAARSSQRWALFGAAALGRDRFLPHIKRFMHAKDVRRRAGYLKISLEALAMTESKHALLTMFKTWLTKQGKSRYLARTRLELTARQRGLTLSGLGDRSAPDITLHGQRFDYGRRVFTLEMHSDMTLQIRTPDGNLRGSLPKPSLRDDSQKSAAALAEWNNCKHLIADLQLVQPVLLERAMVDERRWTIAEFRTLFMRHPLMRYFTQTLVWGLFQGDSLVNSFHLTADLTLADAQHRLVELPDADAQSDQPNQLEIGIVHPAQLSESERMTWGEMLHEYENIPFFAQIGREVYTLTPDERAAGQITRFNEKSVQLNRKARSVTLDMRGWTRDMGINADYTRTFGRSGITIELTLKSQHYYYDMRVSQIAFTKQKAAIPIEQVPAVVISEILRDLTDATRPIEKS